MTDEQLLWASKQFWFERSGGDEQGLFVVGRESYGSRVALVFYDFARLAVWAELQRDS